MSNSVLYKIYNFSSGLRYAVYAEPHKKFRRGVYNAACLIERTLCKLWIRWS